MIYFLADGDHDRIVGPKCCRSSCQTRPNKYRGKAHIEEKRCRQEDDENETQHRAGPSDTEPLVHCGQGQHWVEDHRQEAYFGVQRGERRRPKQNGRSCCEIRSGRSYYGRYEIDALESSEGGANRKAIDVSQVGPARCPSVYDTPQKPNRSHMMDICSPIWQKPNTPPATTGAGHGVPGAPVQPIQKSEIGS